MDWGVAKISLTQYYLFSICVTFKMRCHTKGISLKLLTYPQQVQHWVEGTVPNYVKTSILDYPKNVLQSVFEYKLLKSSFKIYLKWVDGDWEISLGHLVDRNFMLGEKVLRVLNKYTKTGSTLFFKFRPYFF